MPGLLKPRTPFRTGHPINRGLVGAWLVSEGAGATLYDASGYRNNGSLAGSPLWSAGNNGPALLFNGTSQQVSVPNSPSINLSSGSVTMALRITAFSTPASAAFYGLVGKRDDSQATIKYQYGINYRHAPTPLVQIYTSGASGIQGFSYDVPVGKDTFLVGIISAVGPTALYVNGALFGTAGSGGGITGVASSPPLIIANSGINLGAGNEYFNGLVSYAALWNRALSAAEIAYLYRATYDEFRPALRPELISFAGGAPAAPIGWIGGAEHWVPRRARIEMVPY